MQGMIYECLNQPMNHTAAEFIPLCRRMAQEEEGMRYQTKLFPIDNPQYNMHQYTIASHVMAVLIKKYRTNADKEKQLRII